MEEQNKNNEQNKKKGSVDIISIIYAVGCIYLFGPLPGILGLAAEEVMKRALAKKEEGNTLYTVASYVVGAVVAVALNAIFRKMLGSL